MGADVHTPVRWSFDCMLVLHICHIVIYIYLQENTRPNLKVDVIARAIQRLAVPTLLYQVHVWRQGEKREKYASYRTQGSGYSSTSSPVLVIFELPVVPGMRVQSVHSTVLSTRKAGRGPGK